MYGDVTNSRCPYVPVLYVLSKRHVVMHAMSIAYVFACFKIRKQSQLFDMNSTLLFFIFFVVAKICPYLKKSIHMHKDVLYAQSMHKDEILAQNMR